jgi:hypothetical protein
MRQSSLSLKNRFRLSKQTRPPLFDKPEQRRPVHVVCAPKEEYLAIITSYIPSLKKWEADYKTRRKK